jgi:hypothetical protein
MGLPIGFGTRKDIIKYDAKAAKWKLDDKVLNSITMIVNMDDLEVGPMRFTQGAAPDFRLVRAAELGKGVGMPPLPADVDDKGKKVFRNGFRAFVKLPDQLTGKSASVREWASNSGATCDGLNALYDRWEVEKDQHPGKVPVVKMTASEAISGAFGTNYRPVFTIVRWVDRPADLQANCAAADTETLNAVVEAVDFDNLEDDEWGTAEPVDVDIDPDEASFS